MRSENQTDRAAHSALTTILGASDGALEADGRVDFFLNEDKELGGWKSRSVSRRFGVDVPQGQSRPRCQVRCGSDAAAGACKPPPRRPRLRCNRRAPHRRRRHSAILSPRQAARRRTRFLRPDRQGAQPSVARRRGPVGALQARPARGAHPGRRGAGHEPRPVASRAGDRRGFFRGRGRRAARRARSSPSATTSSRSSASRAPSRVGSSRCSASLRGA